MIESLDFRDHHAVVIGIDEYGGGIPRLRTAVADARRIAQALEADHGYEAPRLLIDDDVTLARLRRLFAEELPAEVGPDDRLLVYFAGHGIALDGDDGPAGFLVPQDAHRNDRASFLPMTELSACLEALTCRHLLLVLDCCFAGAFRWSSTRDMGAPPEVMYRERFDRFVRDPAWQVLTSAAHDQKALDVLSGETIGVRGRDAEAAEHSPFAAAFLRALAGEADVARGKQAVGDGVVTATELYLFLRDAVEVGAEGIGHRQTPGFWPLKRHDKGEFVHLVPGHVLDLPPAPELTDDANPWRGLRSYDEEQAHLFFGRSAFVARLAERVRSRPLTVVLGASGTGKSSVVKAGLLALLRAREPDAWTIRPPFRPGKSPLAALAALILPGEAADPEAAALRLAVAKADPQALARRVEGWAASTPTSPARLLLVVDQFEELITLCPDADERGQFLHQLDLALAAHPERLRVVLTLRSDFEPQFARTPLQDEWLASRVVVPAWTLDEYREAIEGPAAARVLYFRGHSTSQAFISRLIGDVANTPGALPLLSFTLSELYRRYLASGAGDRSLSEADYEALGGVAGSLRNRADEIHDGLPDDAHRAALERVMLRMVSVEGGELARRRVTREEIVYDSEEENRRVAEVLRRMDEARLVVSGKDEDDRPIFEPAHDELIRGWSRLLQWTRGALDSLQLRQVLSPAVRDWSGDTRPDPGKLWHANPRLALLAAELGLPHLWREYLAKGLRDLMRRTSPGALAGSTWLNQDELRFVAQSLARKHRTTSIVATTTIVTIAVLAGLARFAFVQRGRAELRANVATSRQLAATAESWLKPRLDRALLLGAQAYRMHATSESRGVLFRALQSRPGLTMFLHAPRSDLPRDLRFSEDGRTLAADFPDGRLKRDRFIFWDVARRSPIADPLMAPEVKSGLWGKMNSPTWAFCPSTRRVAVAGADGGSISLLDPSGVVEMTLELAEPRAGVLSLRFGPGGHRLAASTTRGPLVWDLSTRHRTDLDPGVTRSDRPSSEEKLVFDSRGELLAAAFAGRIVVWDLAEGKAAGRPLEIPPELRALPLGRIDRMAFSPDGRAVAAYLAGVLSGKVLLWDRREGGPPTGPPYPIPGLLVGLDFTPDGSELVVAVQPFMTSSNDHGSGVVSIHPIAAGRPAGPGREIAVSEGKVTSLAIHPEGRAIAVGYAVNTEVGVAGGGVLLLEDEDEDGTDLSLVPNRADGTSAPPLLVAEGGVFDVAFHADGRTLAAAFANGIESGGVTLWDIKAREGLERVVDFGIVPGAAAIIPMRAAVPEITTMILAPVHRRHRLATSIAYHPDGEVIGCGFVEADRSGVSFHSATDLQASGPPVDLDECEVRCIAYHPGGKILAAGLARRGGGSSVLVWDLARGQSLGAPLDVPAGDVTCLAFNSAGDILAVGCADGNDGNILLWEGRNWRDRKAAPIATEEPIYSIAFHPAGDLLAAGTMGFGRGFVILADARRGKPEGRPIEVPEQAVTAIAFRPDGKAFSAGTGGEGLGRVLTWDAETRRPIGLPIDIAEGDVSSLAFRPSGDLLAIGYLTNEPRDLGGIIFVEPANGQRLGPPLQIENGPVCGIAFHPKGLTLAAAIGLRSPGLLSSGKRGGIARIDTDFDAWARRASAVANRELTQVEWDLYVGPDVPRPERQVR